MDYVVGTLHGQGYTRIFTTEKFSPNPADFETIKTQGLDIVNRGFIILNNMLPAEGYALGGFGIADARRCFIPNFLGR